MEEMQLKCTRRTAGTTLQLQQEDLAMVALVLLCY